MLQCFSAGKYKNLVSMKDVIEGRPPMLPNSLVLDKDGSIYWTDSSTYHHLHDGLFTCLASANGRLFLFLITLDSKKKIKQTMSGI